MKTFPLGRLSGHFHDMYGQAIANIVAALQVGMNRKIKVVAADIICIRNAYDKYDQNGHEIEGSEFGKSGRR